MSNGQSTAQALFDRKNLETPKTLDQAILHAFCTGPLNELKDRSYFTLKDFLAQKFGAAYLNNTNSEVVEVLEKLFRDLTRREES